MKQLTLERICEIFQICEQKQQAGEISWYVFECVDEITSCLLVSVLDKEQITLNKRNYMRRHRRHLVQYDLITGCFAQAWAAIKQANRQAEAAK